MTDLEIVGWGYGYLRVISTSRDRLQLEREVLLEHLDHEGPLPGAGSLWGLRRNGPQLGRTVYRLLFGGTDGAGGTGFPVHSYNVATNTWTTKTSRVGVFNSNGVGKIGSKLYFSGGQNGFEGPSSFTNLLWAYEQTLTCSHQTLQDAQSPPLEKRLMEDLQCSGARNAAGHSPGGDHRVRSMGLGQR